MSNHHPNSPWTRERIARLRHLWDHLGWSGDAIARDLGVTKNAVIGKARRLGLKPRPSPIRRVTLPVNTPAEAKRRSKPRPRPKVAGPRIDNGAKREMDRLDLDVPLEPLEPPQVHAIGCQWLEGDGPWSDADKCGKPRLRRPNRAPSSYCPKHHWDCYVAKRGGGFDAA